MCFEMQSGCVARNKHLWLTCAICLLAATIGCKGYRSRTSSSDYIPFNKRHYPCSLMCPTVLINVVGLGRRRR
jgi:hypothetical protein